MENNIYQNNLKILKQKYPNIYQDIINNKIEINDEISSVYVIKSKNSIPTLEITINNIKYSLHSKFNPLREIDRIVELKISGMEDVIIIIGFELGYLTERVIQKNPDARIFIFEPSLKILNRAFKTRNLIGILEHKNLKIITGYPTINDEILDNLTIYNPTLLYTHAYKRAFPDFTEKILSSYDKYIQRNSINIATLKRFDRLWTKNSFKNAMYFFTKPGIYILNNFLNNSIGALVIGAGPSIEKDILGIKKLRNQFILISVDTAFRPLIKHNLIPDFIVSVDPQYINSLSLNPSFYKKIPPDKMPILVVDPAIYPTTLKNYPGKIILTSSIFPPGKIIENFSGYKGKIAAGGSVAVTAFDLARILGTNPIILLGLDLSYVNDQSHIKGSFVDLYRLIIQDRINTSLTQFTRYLKGGIPIKTINNKGKICYTDKRMLLYKTWFEKNIPISNSTIINATNEGLKLTDVKSKQLKDIKTDNISTFNKEIILYNRLSKIYKLENSIKKLPEFIKYLRKTEENLKKMYSLAQEAKIILAKMNTDKSFDEKNKKLSYIEKSIISFSEEIKLISITMQSTVIKIMKGTDKKDKNIIISESDMLYNSIEESCNFLLKIIEKTKLKLNFLISKTDNKSEDVDNL